MVNVRPFRGLRYDPTRVDDFARVLAPPYDVVDADYRAELGARSKHNCIHVIVPEGDDDARYAHGAARFRELERRALVRDDVPSIYVYHQRFDSEGQTYVRKGIVCLIELTRFGDGHVRPHERTMAGPKRDRLELMRACQAHLELVFGMFGDPERQWEALVGDHLGEPVLDCEFDGAHHTLHALGDGDAIARLVAHLGQRNVYIADGHHRYETMCAFRDELEADGHERATHGMIYLSNLDDPGLVVLPTHRVVHGLSAPDVPALLTQAERWFTRTTEALPSEPLALRERLGGAGRTGPTVGVSIPGTDTLDVLTLRADFDPASAGLGALAPALQRLDVALLHELLLERGLGIDKAAQAAKTNLRYLKSTEVALAEARTTEGDAQVVWFMNPTPVSDVRAVCDSGEVMPQKSTFFYPKIPTGLVFYDLRAG